VIIRARCVVVRRDDVDTDQIIPARFLKGTTRAGLGPHAFNDWPERPTGGGVLVAGRNFGCGSSREHAVWALVEAGFRAVIAPSFADIFAANALKNGLVPVACDMALEAREEVTIDVAAGTIESGGRRATFPLDPFARYCLVNGVDELGFLLEQSDLIGRYERAR
jgi:3-isopropylmalate/(R)-2-methylmalate dehydratase small subunit